MSTTKREPSLLGVLLRELFQKKKWQQQLEKHKVFSIWEDVVGPDIAAHATPDYIRGEVLWLRVTDSVWMQHLHLQKRLLLASINERLGSQGLQDIRFRLDTKPACRRKVAASIGRPEEAQIGAGDLGHFEEMVLSLKDEELKATMRRLWCKSRSRRNGPG